MLMRYAKVTAEGKYVPPPAANAKASYATMVYVRATIVEDAGWYLAKAATIAVRFMPFSSPLLLSNALVVFFIFCIDLHCSALLSTSASRPVQPPTF